MRKFTRYTLFTMMLASPLALAAQDMPDGMQDIMPAPVQDPTAEAVEAVEAVELMPEQQLEYDSWPVERQAMYDGWPATHRTYYWTLEPEKQAIYWQLSDQNRADLGVMDDEGKMKAWDAINAQINAPPPGAVPPPEAPPPEGGEMPDPADPAEPR